VRFRRELFVRFGMRWTRDSARFLWTGFLTGFAGLVAFALVSVAAGHTDVVIRQLPASRWAERIAEGLATGILIGVLEEFLFRGAVFTYVRDAVFRGRILPGMAVTSLLYAVLHFIHVRQPVISANPGMADSWRLILAPLQSLADWPEAWPSAVGLFLFGMVLNQALVRSTSLYPSIGLHAGCVTFLRIVGLFLRFDPANTWLWSTKRVYDGAAGWTFLLLIGFLLMVRLKRAAPST
jgi:membrane protease YdiL (CAAX protease family)